jgi:hypothetical protein
MRLLEKPEVHLNESGSKNKNTTTINPSNHPFHPRRRKISENTTHPAITNSAESLVNVSVKESGNFRERMSTNSSRMITPTKIAVIHLFVKKIFIF